LAHAEDIIKLRQAVTDAVKSGVLDQPTSEVTQMVLLQVMNEAEKRKQSHEAAAGRAREQASAEEAQAKAFGALNSMVFSILNGLITKQQQVNEEEVEKAEENEE